MPIKTAKMTWGQIKRLQIEKNLTIEGKRENPSFNLNPMLQITPLKNCN